MAKVFDVGVVLDHAPTPEMVEVLFAKLQAQSIHCVDLGPPEPTGRAHELRFAVYADLGQFLVSRQVARCVADVFATDLVAVNERN